VTVLSGQPSHRVFSLQTNLPVGRSPLGTATLEVVRQFVDATLGQPPKLTRQTVYTLDLAQIYPGDALTVLAHPTPAQLNALPEITRSAPDAASNITLSLRIRTTDLPEGSAIFVARDPLGRTQQLSEVA
jgi:hypothetical protein